MARNPAQKPMKCTDFSVRLSSMMAEAGEIGLYQTMQKLHEAVRTVGYELAEKSE